ncbi:MAG: FAD:protein FMN transferase [Ruminococcaceae bacterium]|nr:FAD:protein FMN transferase [Oscillospiraceae bacterium]
MSRNRCVLRLLSLLLLLSLCFPLSACAERSHSRSFYLMDTAITVTLYTRDMSLAEERFALAHAHLTELEALWSRHQEGSDLSRLNASASGSDTPIDPRTAELLRISREVSLKTGGAFDPTLAPLSALWENCGAENRLPTSEEIANALKKTGADRYTVENGTVAKPLGMEFDAGGIGKGAAISDLLSLLPADGITGGMISFGSNVAVFGEKPNGKPFRVALRDPKNPNGTVGTMELSGGVVLSVSGDYERYVTVNGQRYHHILDPATGYPSASGLSSVAVLCENGALADALSTALLVMGLEKSLALYASGAFSFEAILITSSGECHLTSPAVGFSPTP